MAPSFYVWGSTASRLEPLSGGIVLFTIKFPEIPNIGKLFHTITQFCLEFCWNHVIFNTEFLMMFSVLTYLNKPKYGL